MEKWNLVFEILGQIGIFAAIASIVVTFTRATFAKSFTTKEMCHLTSLLKDCEAGE